MNADAFAALIAHVDFGGDVTARETCEDYLSELRGDKTDDKTEETPDETGTPTVTTRRGAR